MVMLEYIQSLNQQDTKHLLPARVNSDIKDIEWLHSQELVSSWSGAAARVGGGAGSWNSAAAANM